MAHKDDSDQKRSKSGRNVPMRMQRRDGWLHLEDFFSVVHQSMINAQEHLARTDSEGGQVVLKNLRMDLPAELMVEPEDQKTLIRFPSHGRLLEREFESKHLTRIAFELGWLPSKD